MDLHAISMNVIGKHGKYKTNVLCDEFKDRVEITNTRCELSGDEVTGVVFWNKDKQTDISGLRVVRYIRLSPRGEDDYF
jgi:hypothetical protein